MDEMKKGKDAFGFLAFERLIIPSGLGFWILRHTHLRQALGKNPCFHAG